MTSPRSFNADQRATKRSDDTCNVDIFTATEGQDSCKPNRDIVKHLKSLIFCGLGPQVGLEQHTFSLTRGNNLF